jgi:hypothetical protein
MPFLEKRNHIFTWENKKGNGIVTQIHDHRCQNNEKKPCF